MEKEKNIEENFNVTTGTTKIRNQSDYELTEDILSLEDFNLTNTKTLILQTCLNNKTILIISAIKI